MLMPFTAASDSIPTDNESEPIPKALVVLKAAREIFLTHGFSAATTDMIQRQAGVSKSTVYAHYANKEILFGAVIESECTASLNTTREITFRPGNLKDILATVARAYLNIVLSPSGLALVRVIVAEAPRFPDLARKFYLAGPRVIAATVTDLLAKASEANEIDVSQLGYSAAANAFINLVRGEAQLQCLLHPNAAPSEAQIDQWVNDAVTTFMRAYACESKPADI